MLKAIFSFLLRYSRKEHALQKTNMSQSVQYFIQSYDLNSLLVMLYALLLPYSLYRLFHICLPGSSFKSVPSIVLASLMLSLSKNRYI